MSTPHSFLLKLDRACEHLQLLDNQTRTWIEGEPYGVIDESNPEPLPHPLGRGYQSRRFRVNRVSPIPPCWGPIIGDCVFNLRSALDHLALALARKHTPGMTDAQVGGSEFPIFMKPIPSRDEAKKIGCVAPAACEATPDRDRPGFRGG